MNQLDKLNCLTFKDQSIQKYNQHYIDEANSPEITHPLKAVAVRTADGVVHDHGFGGCQTASEVDC